MEEAQHQPCLEGEWGATLVHTETSDWQLGNEICKVGSGGFFSKQFYHRGEIALDGESQLEIAMCTQETKNGQGT